MSNFSDYTDEAGVTRARWKSPGGGSQPLTDPSTLPDLALWLDATQIVGLSDGDPVAVFPDASGNGYDAEQADADLQPSYSAAGLNGLPVVSFPATIDRYLGINAAGLADLLVGWDGLTVAVAAISDDGTGSAYALLADRSGVIRLEMAADGTNTLTVSVSTDPMTPPNGLPQVLASPPALGRVPYAAIGRVTGIPTAVTTLLTNLGAAGGPIVGGSLPFDDTALDRFLIGVPGDTIGGSFMDLGEVLVYSRALTTDEQARLYGYLVTKWGL